LKWFKEMPIISANRVVDAKRIIGKKGSVKEEERHKVSLTQNNNLDSSVTDLGEFSAEAVDELSSSAS
jgi:hypothetical protein